MSGAIRGKERIIPQKTLNVNSSIHNRFDIEVIDSKTGKLKQKAQAENIILDRLWTRMFSNGAAYFTHIHLGSGSGSPAVTDTQLFSFAVAYQVGDNNFTYSNKWDLKYVSATGKITLTETQNVGLNLTEIGIGYSTSATSLCSHAMIKDMNGNTISIVKTETDIINIYATVFLHFDGPWMSYLIYGDMLFQAGSVFAFALGRSSAGTSLAMAARYITVSAFSDNASVDPDSSKTYVSATASRSLETKSITYTYSRLSANIDDFKGYTNIYFQAYVNNTHRNHFAIDVSPLWYPGSIITGEAIGTGDGSTTNFKTKFGDVRAGAKIYVDELDSPATVDINRPIGVTNPFYILMPINSSGTRVSRIESATPNRIGSKRYQYFYNTRYENVGIGSWIVSSSSITSIEYSDDLATWVALTTAQYTSIPGAARKSKYWRLYNNSSSTVVYNFAVDNEDYNIHFSTPPAVGAVITADYVTDLIAKDNNHVLDFSIAFTFGEYTP